MENGGKKTGKSVPTKVEGYTEAFGDRISAAIQRIGTLVDAGKAAGVTDEQLARWRDGLSKPNLFGIAKLAEASGVSVAWLATGEGPETPSATLLEPEESASVPRLDVIASAGPGASGASEKTLEMVPFPRAFLRAIGVSPAYANIVTVAGDSMEPTLSAGDDLIVDTSVKRIRAEALYVLILDGEVVVKRAQRRVNGSILITSDNERYPPEEVTPEATDKLQVAGRVVWFGRSI